MNKLFNQQKSEFIGRHIGPNESEIAQMLQVIGHSSVEELISLTVPNSIRLKAPLQTGAPMS